jgi:3-hydroxyisobutyrate dehydrogenase-like beta-hydroxyacid dehydrogenase
MQLGFVGLGRMGANMVTRLIRGGIRLWRSTAARTRFEASKLPATRADFLHARPQGWLYEGSVKAAPATT